MKDTQQNLSPISIALHWLVGVFGIKLLAANLNAAAGVVELSEPLEHFMHTARCNSRKIWSR